MSGDAFILAVLLVLVGGAAASKYYSSLNGPETFLFILVLIIVLFFCVSLLWNKYSESAKERRKRLEQIKELPLSLISAAEAGVFIGRDENLEINVFLPDSIRSRHIHILGATGSGKTESVILNFLQQDIERGLGAIILDAKGDVSFLRFLKRIVPESKLKIFDLGDPKSMSYDPLTEGTTLESAQRLFSSLNWSEEYYKSKAQAALQRLFFGHQKRYDKNPNIKTLSEYLESPQRYIAMTISPNYPTKLAEKDFAELSGLRDQIKILSTGYLSDILSPDGNPDINLKDVETGSIIYFRLQSLMSPQLVSTLGKLLINHLNFLAGTAHRGDGNAREAKLIPIYLDEFASFASPEFADLISKARSAGYALHFSHQSIGDLAEVSKGFLNQITDNSATKIVLRINDPDTAEFFSRCYGTKIYQKVTQRITNSQEVETAEMLGEGSSREAHQFRASPDLFKTLPTGTGAVLIAHGQRTPHGASSVFTIRFPELGKGRLVSNQAKSGT